MITLKSEPEIAQEFAARVRSRRLKREWSQAEMAGRAGVKLATYIHFERTGRISLLRVLKILGVLDLLPEFERIGQARDLHGLTLNDVVRPDRQRGRRSTSK